MNHVQIGRYTKFPSRGDVAAALKSLPKPGAKDEGVVMMVADAYVTGDLVGSSNLKFEVVDSTP